MRKAVVLMGCAIAAGCGGEDASGGESLVGVWAVEVDNGACAFAFSLQSDGDYQHGTACELDDGTIGLEVERGTYVAANGVITLSPAAASCPGVSDAMEDLEYVLDGERLRVSSPTGVLLLERAPDGDGSSSAAVYGCYGEDGSFTQRDVTPL